MSRTTCIDTSVSTAHPPTYKTRSQCRCSKAHRTEKTFARCWWHRAVWIWGNGPYAMIAWCGATTITLCPTFQVAECYLSHVDDAGCGSSCHDAHEIIRIVRPTR